MRHLVIIFFLLSNFLHSQSGITIHFELQTNITRDMLKGMPESLKDEMIEDVREAKKESLMSIQGANVYCETIAKTISKEVNLLTQKESNNNGKKVINSSFDANHKGQKLIKNYNSNTYSERENGKIITHKLPKAKWVYTNRKKKIIGFNCFEATTTFNNHKLTVYYTKDIAFKASPNKLPFIDGVILEYKYSFFTAKAIKIKRQQPLITNFI
jgi:GLPGLI family protein